MPLTADEAESLLKTALAEEQRRARAILHPYVHALAEIQARRAAPRAPEGMGMTYRGPTAEDIAGPYRAPGWLETLCRDDARFADHLRRYRDAFSLRR